MALKRAPGYPSVQYHTDTDDIDTGAYLMMGLEGVKEGDRDRCIVDEGVGGCKGG